MIEKLRMIFIQRFDILMTIGERISIKMRTNEYTKKYFHSSFLSNIRNEGIILV
jgi:hypothetical protein